MKLRSYLRLMRVHQWIKNAFVLAPLFFSMRMFERESVIRSAIAFSVFCACASAIYVLNDILDRKADQAHPKKSQRTLAAGHVSTRAAWLLLAVLAAIALGLMRVAELGGEFNAVLAAYVAVSVSYSFGLKQIPLVEMFMVASGYVFRVLAGCFAIPVPASEWILAATGSVALLITVGKRRVELSANLDPDRNRRSLGAYSIQYLDTLCSILAGVVIVTYLQYSISDYAIAQFGTHNLMITSIYVAIGVFRYVHLIQTESGADAPAEMLLNDRSIQITIVAWLATFYLLVVL